MKMIGGRYKNGPCEGCGQLDRKLEVVVEDDCIYFLCKRCRKQYRKVMAREAMEVPGDNRRVFRIVGGRIMDCTL